ncbi:MAG TPA: RIP metalloprotease RseP [Candidatus Sulfotelmatobacter sp.]|nr:RIP metalloprotease RseP [Candidatus Sulfotelmatobacter sp.]
MQALSWIGVIIAVVLLFGAAVFVHEFGHFWMARRRGLKVEGFSIGFGPKIFGWTRDGIDYAWRWIPAGGYVKLPQMITSEALEGKSEETPKLPPVSPFSKILVALAGPVMNALFAFAIAGLIYVVGLPVRVSPAILGQVEPGTPEAQMGLRPGDRIVAVNGKLVKSWEDAQMIAAMAPTNRLPVTFEREGVRTTQLLPTKLNEQLGLKLLDLEPMEHPVIEEIKAGSAAEAAGLKKGDQVLSFASVRVVGQKQLVDLIKKRPGEPSPMEIKRGAETLKLTVTPKLDPDKQVGLLGVMIAPNLTSVYQVQRPGPLPWEMVGEVCQQTFDTLGALFHSKATGVGVKDLSGPPGILAMLAVQLKADYRLALKFMVLLNISLALLNLLPLPVLDGGHIAMAVVEQIRGRPLSPRIQEYATTTFALLLISFMLYVSYNDVVKRFPLFRSMFKEQVQIEPGAGAANAPAPGK